MAQVEVDEVLRFVRNVRAEIAPDDAVPRRIVLLVEFFLDERRYIFLDVVFLHRLRCAFDGVLLHVFGHVGVLDYGFSFGHFRLATVATDDSLCYVRVCQTNHRRGNESILIGRRWASGSAS